MWKAVKDWYRRWQLDRRGILPEVQLPVFTAGARSGIWTVCPEYLSARSVVYSFGVGDNLAWDLALIERFGLSVFAFDPTPASVDWVQRQTLPERLHFSPVGLAGQDGTLMFHLPASGSRFNFRSGAVVSKGMTVEAPVARLETLMRRLGQTQVDVLKLDIEGSEYAALDDLLAGSIRPRQLLVEFHHHFPGIGIRATERAVHDLQQAGYRIFYRSPRGLELSFVWAPPDTEDTP